MWTCPKTLEIKKETLNFKHFTLSVEAAGELLNGEMAPSDVPLSSLQQWLHIPQADFRFVIFTDYSDDGHSK